MAAEIAHDYGDDSTCRRCGHYGPDIDDPGCRKAASVGTPDPRDPTYGSGVGLHGQCPRCLDEIYCDGWPCPFHNK